MQFLKTLFWAAFAVVLALFAHANWFPVQVKLWSDLVADVKLPVLVFAAFLIGFVPTAIILQARLWSLKRRLDTHERNLVNSQPAPVTDAPAAPAPPVSETPTAS